MLFRCLKQVFECGRPERPAPRAGLRLDALEDRTVPSTVVTDFPGYGLYRYDTSAQTWEQLNGHDAATLAVDSATGDVVATFRGFGTALWQPSIGWIMLTGADASLLSISGSAQSIVGQFGAAGVWEFHPNTGWFQLTAANSTSVAVDAAGDVVAEFPGYGVWYFTATNASWSQLTAANASQVVFGDVGYVVGEFPGAGVWDWATSDNTWLQLDNLDAVVLAGTGAGGLVGLSIKGYGTYAYNPDAGSWALRTAAVADLLATNGADFAAVFAGQGTWHFDFASGAWTETHPFDASGIGNGGA
jgi:hypothetical protein